MKKKYYYCWTSSGAEYVETRLSATSAKEARKYLKDQGLKIDGQIRLSKKQY